MYAEFTLWFLNDRISDFWFLILILISLLAYEISTCVGSPQTGSHFHTRLLYCFTIVYTQALSQVAIFCTNPLLLTACCTAAQCSLLYVWIERHQMPQGPIVFHSKTVCGVVVVKYSSNWMVSLYRWRLIVPIKGEDGPRVCILTVTVNAFLEEGSGLLTIACRLWLVCSMFLLWVSFTQSSLPLSSLNTCISCWERPSEEGDCWSSVHSCAAIESSIRTPTLYIHMHYVHVHVDTHDCTCTCSSQKRIAPVHLLSVLPKSLLRERVLSLMISDQFVFLWPHQRRFRIKTQGLTLLLKGRVLTK